MSARSPLRMFVLSASPGGGVRMGLGPLNPEAAPQ